MNCAKVSALQQKGGFGNTTTAISEFGFASLNITHRNVKVYTVMF